MAYDNSYRELEFDKSTQDFFGDVGDAFTFDSLEEKQQNLVLTLDLCMLLMIILELEFIFNNLT